ncbi:MAG: flagellar biosynthesis protein FlgL [Pseudorhodoplanes sp.]|nr:flagellar biosynthesis protein FlgL [Pseudorhodoplanes sp.]
MSVGGVGMRSAAMVQSLLAMRTQLGNLQQQMATGKKADTYAGLGLDRGLTVGLRGHLSAISAFGNTITNVGVRLDLAQSTLTRIAEIGREVKAATAPVNSPSPQMTQKLALNALGEILGLLNTQAGDRYLFSGLAADQPAVETVDRVLDGDGVRAGLRQVISERQQADLGASGLGRVAVTAPTATSVEVAEDVAGSPFGFKLASIATGVTGATVSAPAGAPPAMAVDFGAATPAEGETVTLRFTLPDGTTEALTLTATTSAPPGAGEFTIGATPADTAANFQAALTGSLGTLARTALTTASAVAASDNFFNMDAANPPQRVAGPPFDTATALVDGTASNTMFWYTGEAGSGAARATAGARIDQSISVNYGLRANEEGIRWQLQNIAVTAALTITAGDPDAAALSAALNDRVRPALDVPQGKQTIETIQSELAGAQASIQAAKERHQQTSATLGNFLQQVEGVSNEEVAAQILALQTRLQASLQTTAILYQTNLLQYL